MLLVQVVPLMLKSMVNLFKYVVIITNFLQVMANTGGITNLITTSQGGSLKNNNGSGGVSTLVIALASAISGFAIITVVIIVVLLLRGRNRKRRNSEAVLALDDIALNTRASTPNRSTMPPLMLLKDIQIQNRLGGGHFGGNKQ